MGKAKQRHSRLRRAFRWFRIFLWLIILTTLLAGLYLNKVGLPDFLKSPLLSRIRAEGVQLDFGRMRLRWYRGIVLDQAAFTFLKSGAQPGFSSIETEVNLDWRLLLETRLKVNSIIVKQGVLAWPLSKTNQDALTFSNILARIEFPSSEEMRIEELEGDYGTTHIKVTGAVTNYSAVRSWKIKRPKTDKRKGNLEKLNEMLQRIKLASDTRLFINFSGDLKDPNSFFGTAKFNSAWMDTPWAEASELQMNAEVRELLSDSGKNSVRVQATHANSRWGSVSNLNLLLRTVGSPTNIPFSVGIELATKQFQTEAGSVSALEFIGQSRQTWTNPVPHELAGTAQLLAVETKWGRVDSAKVVFTAETNSAPKNAGASWAQWSAAERLITQWSAQLNGLTAPKLQVEQANFAGSWNPPQLVISNLDAQLYRGGIQATAQLNVLTRDTHVKGTSDFDVQQIAPLLSRFAQRWLAKYTWEMPPRLVGDLRIILPAWTNRAPDRFRESQPTLVLDGSAIVGKGSYRQVAVESAKTHFNYSNMVWSLPDLRVDRPEGGADLSLIADDSMGEFRWMINSQIDPKALRHLFEPAQQRVFDDFQLTAPPHLRAELRGRWNETENIFAEGEILAKNFSWRSNVIDQLSSSFLVTNQLLRAREMRLDRADKFITAQEISLNLPTQRLFFTNVYSTENPYLIARLIGRKVAAQIVPYQFFEPPAIRLNGGLTIGKVDDADLHFSVEGTRFQWTNFITDNISGQIDWVGQTVLLTNLHAAIYKGRARGWSHFDFRGEGTSYRFDVAAADIDLQTAVKSFKGTSNYLEGVLHGHLSVKSGNTRDTKTVRGNGRVNVRNGLLWDVPLFGMFSPMLNAIVPGAGNSRAHEASATFTLNHGIIYSDDLQIRSPILNMQYRGGIDFDERIDARVEAELLRDTWMIGRIVSLALSPLTKLFEYKVTGTLTEPESEPVYIPNILMMTLRPFHSLKKALAPEKSSPAPTTNSAAEKNP